MFQENEVRQAIQADLLGIAVRQLDDAVLDWNQEVQHSSKQVPEQNQEVQNSPKRVPERNQERNQ